MSDNREILKKIETDEDFINYPRYGNSIKNLVENNPNGVDNKKISKALMMSEQQVEDTFRSALGKIRKIMGV